MVRGSSSFRARSRSREAIRRSAQVHPWRPLVHSAIGAVRADISSAVDPSTPTPCTTTPLLEGCRHLLALVVASPSLPDNVAAPPASRKLLHPTCKSSQPSFISLGQLVVSSSMLPRLYGAFDVHDRLVRRLSACSLLY